MGKVTDSFLRAVNKGRLGDNQGLAMGMPKLESVIDGVTQETYALVFGSTGSGKTSFVLYSYIYKPLMENIDTNNFKIIYYSLEMSAEALFTKLASIYIWEQFGKELSFKDILSKRKGELLSDEDYKVILEVLPWLNKVESIMTIYDKKLNAERFYAHLSKEMEKYGTIEKSDDGARVFYTLHNPKQITLVVVDHIGLVVKSNGRTKKEEIDTISNYAVTFRNRCKITFVPVMQMNRGASSMDRRSAGFQEPQLDDIKDSGGPSEDAEVVLAIFHPHREKMPSYHGYDIKQIRNNFRAIVCLKNRYGDTDVSIGCGFYGASGVWQELPKANEITDYSKYTCLSKPDKPITQDQPIDEQKPAFYFL